MKRIEILANVTHDGNIEISEEDRRRLPHDQKVRLVVLDANDTEKNEEAQWSRLTAEEFLKGYAEADSIYDQL